MVVILINYTVVHCFWVQLYSFFLIKIDITLLQSLGQLTMKHSLWPQLLHSEASVPADEYVCPTTYETTECPLQQTITLTGVF